MTPAQFNAWRIMPRILMIAYYAFFVFAFEQVSVWFMSFDFTSIENQAVALAVAGFPVGILGVLSGVLLKLTEHYFKTGGPTGNGNGG